MILWATFLLQTLQVYLQPLRRKRPQKLANSVK